MGSAEWILDLLTGDFDSAENKLISKGAEDGESFINLLAVKLAKRDFEGVLNLTSDLNSLFRRFSPTMFRKIIDYRLIAAVYNSVPQTILPALRMLRRDLLFIFVFPYPLLRLADLRDLLDEQKLLFIRRQLALLKRSDDPPLNGATILLLYRKVSDIERGLITPTERAEFYSYLGILLAYLARGTEARRLAETALDLEESYIPYTALGKIYYLSNDYNKAFEYLMRALTYIGDRTQRNIEVLANIAQLYLLAGNYNLAHEYITRAIRIFPDPFVRLIRGISLVNLRRFDEAIVAFKALLGTRERKIQVYALIGLSECFLNKKRYRKAFEYIWRAHMLEPQDEIISYYANILKILSEKHKR